MAVQNTSLLFVAENQSPYYSGRSLDVRIDSGDFLTYNFDQEINLGFSRFNTDFVATGYLNGRFGLVAYVSHPGR
jgi:hypothetical protein